MAFNLQSFLENPSLEVIEKCRKDDLCLIATHFKIPIAKQSLKKQIKTEVIDWLCDLGILKQPDVDEETDSVGEGQDEFEVGKEEVERAATETEVDVGVVLPPFEPFSPGTPSSKGETQTKVRIARLHMEAQDRAQARQAELDFRLEVRRLEIQADKEVRLRKLEIEAAKVTSVPAVQQSSLSVSNNSANSGPTTFEVGKHIALVPNFRESEVDSYFNAFEKIATSLGWPKNVWSLLLQCKLVGKALEVYSTLSLEDGLKYDVVKLAILRAYELVPEAYRQHFRNRKKHATQTFVEFARDKSILFDKWCTSSKADDFVLLRELMLLEEFKQCLPERMVLYLNEQKVTTLSQAGVLADEFMLTHKNVFQSIGAEKSFVQRSSVNVQPTKQNGEKSKETRECFYCHRKGHVIADCLSLKRKQYFPKKEVAFVNSVNSCLSSEQKDELPDPTYLPFLFKGFVSFTSRKEDQVEVQVLRDTGAAQSFVCADVLPFSDQSSVGSSRLVQSFSMEVMKVPIHRIHLQCELITDFVEVGVRPALPVKGVSFILGNDLAGGKVIPSLEVMDAPLTQTKTDELFQKYPSAFPACAVTRAQAKKDNDLSLVDSFLSTDGEPEEIAETKSNDIEEERELVMSDPLPLTVTREKLIDAQNNDPSLAKCFKLVEDGEFGNVSFFVKDGLLMRRWNKSNSVENEWKRFHQTLKAMLRKYCSETGNEWDEGVPLLLFAIRETIQESLKFSPSELVFGHTVRGPLKVLKEKMLGIENDEKTNVLEYVSRFRERLQESCTLAREALSKAQGKMKAHYDKGAANRSFAVGNQVLVLLPVPGSALSVRFSGPYEILEKKSDTDYVVRTPDRKRQKRVCHINMLKAYNSREAAESLTTEGKSDAVFPVGVVCETSPSVEQENADQDGFLESDAPLLSARLSNSETLGNLSNVLGHLDDDQRQDVVELLDRFPSILGDAPTLTNVLQHDIVVSNAPPIKQHPYRVNTVKRSIMKQETQYLLEKGLAKPSISPWSSPCLLVQKSDGTKRFCTDYRRVNAVTIPDCFPMPRMEDCVDSVGSAKFVSKLDLLKGYWQVPLTARASEISAFVTPDCFLQYNVMAFGLRNAAATFQRLVNLVLADVPNVNAYLDDLIVYSQSWPEHVSLLQTVFERLERAFLTLNLSKCEIGKATVTYLGKQVGEGQVRPLTAKITAISEFPAPRTRRELRRFLGMAGYYRCFCRNFSSVAVPLTALLSPSETFVWSPECQTSFDNIKALLCSEPVLSAPNFEVAFKLEVDASEVGAGAVLLQEDKGEINHPICYYSKKFNRSQRNYSTIEKEALALLLALQHFEVYVGSSILPVVVYTDHNPLTFISRMRNQNQRLMRWSLIIQNYNLEIKYKKGTENVVADALSRV